MSCALWRQLLARCCACCRHRRPRRCGEPGRGADAAERGRRRRAAAGGRAPARQPAVSMRRQDRTPGRHGGELRMLMGGAKDVRMMVVYGYARLVGYDRDFELVPDILETLRGRGRPDLHAASARGPPLVRRRTRSPPRTSATAGRTSPTTRSSRRSGRREACWSTASRRRSRSSTRRTVRYTWTQPNPFFLPALAGAAPLYIYRAGALPQAVPRALRRPEASSRRWSKSRAARTGPALHNRLDSLYKNDNPDLPTLQPWVVTTEPPSDALRLRAQPVLPPRRPERPAAALHRPGRDDHRRRQADPGQDRRRRDRPAGARPAASTTTPSSSRARSATTTRCDLWRTAKGSHIALYPNLNVDDPVWRELFRDVRFRRALSLAIDRARDQPGASISGWRVEGNNTVLPESPLFKPEYQTPVGAVTIPTQANALLDEIGLTSATRDGIRLLPDGRPLEIIVETAGEEHRADRRAGADPRAPGARSASSCSPSRRSARCSATGSSPARP